MCNSGTRAEVDGESPVLGFRKTGYMFLATPDGIDGLRRNLLLQRACGADIHLLDPDQLAERFPYLRVDDLAGASFGETGDGTFDANSLLMGLRQGRVITGFSTWPRGRSTPK